MSEIFKTDFRGYNKEEVSNYIASLNSKLEQLQSELNGKNTEIARLRETTMTAAEREALVRVVRAEAEAELRETIEKECEQRFAAEAAAKAAEAPAPAEPDGELEAIREKARLYDEQKDMIAELMLKARADASQVYADTEKRCASVMDDTAEKLLRFRDDFEEMRKNVETSKSDMDTRLNNIRHYLDDFMQYLEITSGTIDNTISNFRND